jgi:divalent metal cation (Fe/Co/Zn/Cd) transporter
METLVFLAVLFAAACHAGWNALIKIDLDPLPATTLIGVGSAVVGFVVSAFLVRTGLRQAQRL